jgi:glycosyltransferase involved in cell wall biosynthesis
MTCIVQANAVYDRAARTPADLLDSYRTLTEWSDAAAKAGARVSVVQRFHAGATVEHNGIPYRFVTDAHPPWLSAGEAPKEFVEAIVAQSPDVVHLNGLIFPALAGAIRAAAGPKTAIVIQHHGGEFPIRGQGVIGWWKQRQWRRGLAAADALSFTAREQAEPWRAAGVIGDQRIIEIVEASTTMRTVERDRARAAIGVTGSPVILWVGRLTTNKDPLTVLDGLERVLPRLPAAQAVMVFGDDTLLPAVDERVRGSSILRSQVILTGRVTHQEMPNFYGAADVLISGSHSEGSGYALIEAMAAGVVPVVTDIPSFRAIAGECGRRWAAGDAQQCASALWSVLDGDLQGESEKCRARFDRDLSWDAIGQRTVSEYQTIRLKADAPRR